MITAARTRQAFAGAMGPDPDYGPVAACLRRAANALPANGDALYRLLSDERLDEFVPDTESPAPLRRLLAYLRFCVAREGLKWQMLRDITMPPLVPAVVIDFRPHRRSGFSPMPVQLGQSVVNLLRGA